jgi:hypothetical protein
MIVSLADLQTICKVAILAFKGLNNESSRVDNLALKNINHATLNVQVRSVLAYIIGMAELTSFKPGWPIVSSEVSFCPACTL